MVSAYLTFLDVGLTVDAVLSAREVWGPPVAAAVLAAAAAAAGCPDTVRMRIRIAFWIASGRAGVRPYSWPLTCPDPIRMQSADAHPEESGPIPGGGT